MLILIFLTKLIFFVVAVDAAFRYPDKAKQCKSTVSFNTTVDLLWNATSLKRTSLSKRDEYRRDVLVTGTLAEAASLSKLAKNYKALHVATHAEFNATLALKHASVSNVEPFDSVIHLVSHPLASIEALAKLPRVDLDELLPQPFVAANQSALHHAMVHWVAVNSLLEMLADTRVPIEDLGGDSMPGIAYLLLKISAVERQHIAASHSVHR